MKFHIHQSCASHLLNKPVPVQQLKEIIDPQIGVAIRALGKLAGRLAIEIELHVQKRKFSHT